MHRRRSALESRRIMFLFVAFLLRPCCAQQHVHCTVTRGGEWTEYNVPVHQGANCQYSWSNSTGHVIANEWEQDDMVLHRNGTSLRIRGCSEMTGYSRDCISEETPRTSNCTSLCSNMELPQPQKGGESRHHWFAVASVVCSLLLVFLLLIMWVLERCQFRVKTLRNLQPCEGATV